MEPIENELPPSKLRGIANGLDRHSVLDTESSLVFWIPAFAGMTDEMLRSVGDTTLDECIRMLKPRGSRFSSCEPVQVPVLNHDAF